MPLVNAEVETKPPRGLMPGATLASPVDHIDPYSGKLHLDVPLASLPPGRGGSFQLSLMYDSHLYDLEPETIPPQQQGQMAYIGHRLVTASDNGGWTHNIMNYRLLLEERTDIQTESTCPGTSPARPWRLRLGLGDGSFHVLHLRGYGQAPSYDGSGFYPLLPNGGTNACVVNLSDGAKYRPC